MYNTIIFMVLRKYIVIYVGGVVLGGIAIWITHGSKKWVQMIVVIGTIVLLVIGVVRIGQLVLDYVNQDFIVENDAIIECATYGIGNVEGNTTLSLTTSNGDVVTLLYSGLFEKGTYRGTVVYAKKSKIVVHYDLSPCFIEN